MKIKFLTTSTYSDISNVTSSLIKNFFPDSEHIQVDGRKGWFSIWYKWIEYCNDADWYIHLDEDCFIKSEKEIIRTIKYMEDHGYDISGCPDGYHHYRRANHMALNSFFMIMNNKVIQSWRNRDVNNLPQFKKEWIEPYPYEKINDTHYVYEMGFGSQGGGWKQFTEPYYDFMWVAKDNGCKFLYLEPTFNTKYCSTDLLKNEVTHMWFQRQRHEDRIVSPAHTMSNKKRFDLIINDVKELLN